MSKLKYLEDIAAQILDQTIILRLDLDVPMRNEIITDMTRIKASINSIQFILRHNPKCLILIAHMGRPNGQYVLNLSLKPVWFELQRILNHNISFLQFGPDTVKISQNAKNGQIIMLENIRFFKEEEGIYIQNGEKIYVNEQDIQIFRNSLSQLGDIYVNDAFATSHRFHSSMIGIGLPIKGSQMQKSQMFYLTTKNRDMADIKTIETIYQNIEISSITII